MEGKPFKIVSLEIRFGYSEPFRRTPIAEVRLLERLTIFCDLVGGTGAYLRHKKETWGATLCHNKWAIGLNLYHRQPNEPEERKFFGIRPRR